MTAKEELVSAIADTVALKARFKKATDSDILEALAVVSMTVNSMADEPVKNRTAAALFEQVATDLSAN